MKLIESQFLLPISNYRLNRQINFQTNVSQEMVVKTTTSITIAWADNRGGGGGGGGGNIFCCLT